MQVSITVTYYYCVMHWHGHLWYELAGSLNLIASVTVSEPHRGHHTALAKPYGVDYTPGVPPP